MNLARANSHNVILQNKYLIKRLIFKVFEAVSVYCCLFYLHKLNFLHYSGKSYCKFILHNNKIKSLLVDFLHIIPNFCHHWHFWVIQNNGFLFIQLNAND